MKLEAADTQFKSNAESKSTFTIQASPKMFEILYSRIYKNKVGAIVRELSCNALDSHVQAGKADVPFRIQFPSQLIPEFIVEDFGLGLSNEQVQTLYTSYGASTKTDSNDMIGGFGLGSKTPFAYTNNFTVVSRFNGTESVYACFLDADGVPSITKLGSKKTESCNGVAIKIPAKPEDAMKFRSEVALQLRMFSVKPDVGADAVPWELTDKQLAIFNEIGVVNIEPPSYSYRDQQSYAVMGSVAYPISISNMGNLHYSGSMYVKFDIGELPVSVSREGISLDAAGKVQEIIDAKFIKAIQAYKKYALQKASLVPTPIGRVVEYMKLVPGNVPHSIVSSLVPEKTRLRGVVKKYNLVMYMQNRYGSKLTRSNSSALPTLVESEIIIMLSNAIKSKSGIGILYSDKKYRLDDALRNKKVKSNRHVIRVVSKLTKDQVEARLAYYGLLDHVTLYYGPDYSDGPKAKPVRSKLELRGYLSSMGKMGFNSSAYDAEIINLDTLKATKHPIFVIDYEESSDSIFGSYDSDYRTIAAILRADGIQEAYIIKPSSKYSNRHLLPESTISTDDIVQMAAKHREKLVQAAILGKTDDIPGWFQSMKYAEIGLSIQPRADALFKILKASNTKSHVVFNPKKEYNELVAKFPILGIVNRYASDDNLKLIKQFISENSK